LISAKRAAQILNEARDTLLSAFDIFLSHSILDAELVLGAKLELEDRGFTVYVDWLSDPLLKREQVTSTTADHLRTRMRQCKMLVYVHSENAALSRWCPWELGYFDGLRGGNVFILPVFSSARHTYDGQEYLGLYPYLEPAAGSNNIWIERAGGISYLTEARSKTFSRKAA
jgi:hypothetical protein